MNKEQRVELLERFERATELPLLALAVAMIPLLLVPLFVDLSRTADDAFLATDWIIWAVFAIELSIRAYLAPRRLPYLAAHWYDVLIVALPFLRPLRIVRSARALRALRLGRLMPFSARIVTESRELLRRRGLQYVLAAGVASVFACAAAVLLVERSHGGNIDDYGTALWWSISTLTTVGYGDVVPSTPEGKGIAIFLMLVGISFFSWVTASIAAFLVEFGGSEARTVTVADLMDKLEAIEREIQLLRESRSG